MDAYAFFALAYGTLTARHAIVRHETEIWYSLDSAIEFSRTQPVLFGLLYLRGCLLFIVYVYFYYARFLNVVNVVNNYIP